MNPGNLISKLSGEAPNVFIESNSIPKMRIRVETPLRYLTLSPIT